jgi:Voltage-dependent anion channel
MRIDGMARTVVPDHPQPPGHHGLLRDLDRPADVFAHLGPNWFASVMGTGIVATAAATLPIQWPGLHGFAAAIWVLCALWLITLTGAEVAHWARHRSAALGHARNPVMVQFYGAPPMALLTVGAVASASTRRGPFPSGTADCTEDFTELVGTVVGKRREPGRDCSSRTRIVAAADQTRRRIERDLHEIARAMHPAILPEGGLGPALRTLACRAAIAVALDVAAIARLPEPVEWRRITSPRRHSRLRPGTRTRRLPKSTRNSPAHAPGV